MTGAAWHVNVVGIGTGNPDHLTIEGIEALRRAEVFLVTAKDGPVDELGDLRRAILKRHVDRDASVVEVVDPRRDREAGDYRDAVVEWHAARARAWQEALQSALPEGGRAAILAWGDPSLYDSSLRILDQAGLAIDGALTYDVIPGISAISVLAARHRIVLNQIGQPVHITTGRLLPEAIAAGHPDIVVMLDGDCAFTDLSVEAKIYWGAYLGTEKELLLAGDLAETGPQVVAARAEARAAHGWIMDTYLLRRADP